MKVYKILKEWKIMLLILLVVVSIFSIHPFSPTNGVLIENVKYPAPSILKPGYVIVELNGVKIENYTQFNKVVSNISAGDPVRIKYRYETFPYVYLVKSAPAYLAIKEKNKTSIGIIAGPVPSNNLKFGLELVGGTKVLLSPNKILTQKEMENLIEILKQRLNLFGLKEVPINYVSDLSGNQYIRIEFAGATENDVKMLLEKEGVFEGKIANKTVFTGNDIVDVCISGVQCVSRVYPVYDQNKNILYRFEFQIDITKEAAERFANITKELGIGECYGDTCYLNSTLDLYLDGELIQDGSLRLPESIKGEVLTSAQIVGTRTSMVEAQKEMRRLQAILQSKSLPVKLNIVNIESLSPKIGKEFASNIFIVFIAALSVVAFIISIRYRNLKIALPIITIVTIETISTLGIAALIGWTLDLSSIAGIIASVGTGLDDQIIITDEILSGEKQERVVSIKKRIKKAFFVVMTSFAASFASMVPLAFAGAGILRGFAITTMIGISIGVFITRPAYARICELLFSNKPKKH